MTQPKRSLAFSPRKRALLERMLQAEGLSSSPQPEKISQQNVSCAPLSFAQERLWFLEQLVPGTIVHNIHRAFRTFGALDVATLEKSCNEIIKRHAILRTTFTNSIPPTQKIIPEWTLTIPLIDLRDFSDTEAETIRLATLEVQQPFDLAELPLWRVKLLRVAETEYVLLITIHHLICDGWSFDVFCQELTQYYAALLTGKPALLSELPIQYADYALWQRQWLQGDVLDSQLTYWQQQLSGIEMLKLPTDGTPQTYSGIRQSLIIPQHLTSELKSLSQQQGVTLYMTLLAAWQTLFFKYTKQEDILICSPIAGRNRSETKPMIGCFNNLLPIRSHFNESLTFGELLAQVRQVTISAYEHQDLPFQQIANLVSVPLSRAMFVLQNTPSYPLEFPEITISPLLVHNRMANFDLSLFMEEKNSELFGEVEYKTDLFKPDTINHIIDHFQILLASIVANPQASLAQLPVPIPRGRLQKPQRSSAVAQDELELQLIKIWEKVLGKKPIHRRDNFFELGGHSFLAVRLLAEITRLTGKNIPLDAILTAPTIERLASMLRDRGWSSPWTSLVPIQSGGSQLPFFCVHGAGGHVLNYYSLARQLGTDQPFYGLQAQGMDGKDEIHMTIPQMAAHYIQEIRTIQPHGPYFLGGFCMGGTIALEMAQQLTAAGEQVSLLALMYTFNFGQVPLSQLFPSTPKFIWEQLQCLNRNLALLPLPAKFTFLRERVKTAQHRLMSRLVAMRAMSSLTSLRSLQEKAAIDYIPEFYPGRVTIIRPRVFNFNESPEASWDGVFGEVEVKELPVYPGAMLLEPFVSDLATQLKTCLQPKQEI